MPGQGASAFRAPFPCPPAEAAIPFRADRIHGIVTPMKSILRLLVPALLVLPAASCRDGARFAILFTGDERGWIVPAG